MATAVAVAPWLFPRDQAPAPAPSDETSIVEPSTVIGPRIDHAVLLRDFELLAAMPKIVLQRAMAPQQVAPQQIAYVPDQTGSLGPLATTRLADEPAQKQDLSLLADYVYSEVPPDEKPAVTILNSMKDIPEGTPVEEIKRVSDALGVDFTFLKTVAKIESDFDPKQRTGSYIGLYQLSNFEFGRYGSGDILDARDNAVAGAYKIVTEAALFEMQSHKKATLYDLYLIHQQGIQGATEHVSHPDRVAWESMCATEEGRQKGEKWCKRAIWANTLPAVKKVWKTVDNLTSGAFIAMWHDRMDMFYSRYAQAAPAQ
ncbi:MAG: transglycosylase [Xanthobacteraceae bacterium]